MNMSHDYNSHPLMKRILLAILATTLLVSVNAKPVTVGRAATVAQNFWQQRYGQTAETMEELSSEIGITDLYVFEVNGGKGYVVVSGDDVAYPILAYSSQSGFPTENIAPAVMDCLNTYRNRIAFVRSCGTEPDRSVTDEWRRLEQNIGIIPTGSKAVEQLMTSKWSQNAPYNDMCPADSSGVRCVTGCVATATAQVLRYWKYPEHGVGEHSYTYDGRPIAVINMLGDSNARWTYGTLSVDYENTYYDWENMPDIATESNSEVERQAVATLCYHCGVAMDMVYTPSGSGAFMTRAEVLGFDSVNYSTEISAEVVIPKYFGYSPNTVGLLRDDFTPLEWLNLLKNELNNRRPLIYAGNTEGSDYGHAFVIDGYEVGYYFHCNFGWGGMYDASFRFDEIAPANSGMSFTYKQSGIFRMYPPGRGGSDEQGIRDGETVDYNPLIYSHGRVIEIEGSKPLKGEVYDLMGRRIASFDSNMENRASVRVSNKGIYIVRTGSSSQKIYVQ